MAQIRNDPYTIQSRVFRQSRGDDFHCVRKRFPTYRFCAGEFAGFGREGVCDGYFGGAAAGDEGFLFHEAADHADGVVEGTFCLVEDEGVGAAADDGDSFVAICRFLADAGDLDDAGAGGLDFVEEVGGAELVFGEGVDVGDGFAAEGFADEFDLGAFDVFDGEDVEFGEEVEGEVVDGVAEDGFLDEQDVAFCFLYLLDHVEEVGALFFEDFVHLAVVVYDDLVFHVGFWGGELELDEAYSGFFHSRGAAAGFYDWLVEDEAVYHFAVFDCSAYFLDYPYVFQIDVVGGLLIYRFEHGVYGHRAK